jgi:hypothetical protein
MMLKTRLAFGSAAIALVFLLTGCDSAGPLEPTRTEPISIDAGNAERANVELDMAAGELNVNGGANKIIEGDFSYNISSYKPVVTSTINGSHAIITVKQGSHNSHFSGGGHNVWDLKLSDKMVLDLAINCGAGQAQLGLGSLDLRELDIHMGAGQVDLDLRGHPSRDYDVNLAGGVGQVTVHLPHQTGIYAEAHGGLGSINVSGLEKQGEHYQNSLYDKAKVNIRLKVHGGIGEINIIG